ncbi:MAG: hypothetical protein MJB14_19150 [Spirochaetes bacterium]|nr:hypothetical protein [Spirochaetota bacterium]
MFDLESKIQKWTDYLRTNGKLSNNSISELEVHLRDEMDQLYQKGLTDEEAFLIGIKRIGLAEDLGMEFEKVNRQFLWKDLTFYENLDQPQKQVLQDVFVLIGLSVIAFFLAKLPDWLAGYGPLFRSEAPQSYFYQKTLSFYVFPLITLFFWYKKRDVVSIKYHLIILITTLFSALTIFLMPMYKPYHTPVLTAIHLPIFLWIISGLGYAGDQWKNKETRMNFIRFSGEVFIYGTLLLCGVFVLTGLTILLFKQIKWDIENFYLDNIWLLIFFSVPLFSVYLVEAKKSIVENIAPILARFFSPLFSLTMLFFLIIMVFQKIDPAASENRNFLISFNFLLIMVAGLVTYIISARRSKGQIIVFDYINLSLILLAGIIDSIVLIALLRRISQFGFTANRLAALGENILLFIDLGGLFFYYCRFIYSKKGFTRLESWQTNFINVIVIWCGIVAFLFPLFFQFK